MIDNDRIGIGYIKTGFNDIGTDQDIVFLIDKFQQCFFQVIRFHLSVSHRYIYIQRLKNARAEMQEIVRLAQDNPTIYEPWRMKEVLDHITGWDDAVIASIKSFGGWPRPIVRC